MINHARTLLANLSGGPTGYVDGPGEEFIPSAFKPLAYPGTLQRVRELLLGARPDRLYINYMLRQYLTLLHSTPLEAYVLQLDPRRTYPVPFRDDLDAAFTTTVWSSGPATAANQLFVGGPSDQLANDEEGHCRFTWWLELLGGNTARVQLQQPSGTPEQLVPYSFDNGLSTPLVLPGGPLFVRFNQAASGPWRVTAAARPRRSLVSVLQEARRSLLVQELFGPAGRPAPYDTFYAYWQDHPELPYQLGALLLAWLWRAEAFRVGGG